MSQVQLIMPKMGESVAEATILKWLKNVGDKVEADESILEIATDKVDSEIPSPASGIIMQRMFEAGAVVAVGTVIAVISSEAEAKVSQTPSAPDNGTTTIPSPSEITSAHQVPSPLEKGFRDEAISHSSNGGRFF